MIIYSSRTPLNRNDYISQIGIILLLYPKISLEIFQYMTHFKKHIESWYMLFILVQMEKNIKYIGKTIQSPVEENSL